MRAGSTPSRRRLASASSEGFVVVDLLSSGRRLGYAAVDHGVSPQFLVYTERQLNPDPNVRTRTDEPFANLNYAIYLNDERPEHLLSSSLPNDQLPIDSRREIAIAHTSRDAADCSYNEATSVPAGLRPSSTRSIKSVGTSSRAAI